MKRSVNLNGFQPKHRAITAADLAPEMLKKGKHK